MSEKFITHVIVDNNVLDKPILLVSPKMVHQLRKEECELRLFQSHPDGNFGSIYDTGVKLKVRLPDEAAP